MAIDIGIDEGGDNRDTLLVSAQFGITADARKMKNAWRSRLPMGLPYFHSIDFGNYTGGVFTKAGLNRAARGELLNDLCRFTHQRLLSSVTMRVSISKYESLTTQDFRSQHGTAYSYAVDLCLLAAYAVIKDFGAKPEFNILIEDGHRNSNQAALILERIKGHSENPLWQYFEDSVTDLKILTAGLGSKKDHPILQSADMLAYSEWQKISRGDPTIWKALHRRDVRYVTSVVEIDENLIVPFVEEATPQAGWRRLRTAKRLYEAKQRISEIQSDKPI